MIVLEGSYQKKFKNWLTAEKKRALLGPSLLRDWNGFF